MTDRTMTDITAARYDVVPVLSGAADLLTTEGWCQGEYKNQDGELCLIGAIKAFTPDSYARRSAAYDYVRKAIKHPDNQFLSDWNDEPRRSAGEVIAVLRKASELAREDLDAA